MFDMAMFRLLSVAATAHGCCRQSITSHSQLLAASPRHRPLASSLTVLGGHAIVSNKSH